MKKNIVETFVALGLALLLFIVLYKMNMKTSERIRDYQAVIEAFNNKVSDPIEINSSYSLLVGVLPLKDGVGNFTAERCFQGDFNNRLEKTGNFKQMTNNYKHKDPESCSSTFQDSVGAFYKVDSLPP